MATVWPAGITLEGDIAMSADVDIAVTVRPEMMMLPRESSMRLKAALPLAAAAGSTSGRLLNVMKPLATVVAGRASANDDNTLPPESSNRITPLPPPASIALATLVRRWLR